VDTGFPKRSCSNKDLSLRSLALEIFGLLGQLMPLLRQFQQ
jgi:hypothetical protein